jgi:hypothetical protein
VGSALVRALITSAQARGVTSVAMDVLPGNHQVLAMIAGQRAAARTGHSRDYDTCIPASARPAAPATCTLRPPGRPAVSSHGTIPSPSVLAHLPARAPGGHPGLGCTVSIKLETANPVRSFKARGTEVVASLLAGN